MVKIRTRRALLLSGSAVAVALALTGCSALDGILGSGSGDVGRDAETGQVTESATVDVVSVELGDCMLDSGSGMLTDAEILPCTDRHDQEVYYEITLPEGSFADADIEAASQECIGDAYTSFIGVGYEDSTLNVTTISPTQQSWEKEDDRVVQCLVFDPAGPVTGSLAGTGR